MTRGKQPQGQTYQLQGNVFYVGVARFQDRAIVAGLAALDCKVDLNGVKEVLKSDQLSVRPGVHFSFSSGSNAWHLMSDPEGRIFIVITERTYPTRAARALLEDLQRQFVSKTGTKSLQVKQGGLGTATKDLLKKIIEKYDNIFQVDKLTGHVGNVQSVKLVLQENVLVALANCVTDCKTPADASNQGELPIVPYYVSKLRTQIGKEDRARLWLFRSVNVSICALLLALVFFKDANVLFWSLYGVYVFFLSLSFLFMGFGVVESESFQVFFWLILVFVPIMAVVFRNNILRIIAEIIAAGTASLHLFLYSLLLKASFNNIFNDIFHGQSAKNQGRFSIHSLATQI